MPIRTRDAKSHPTAYAGTPIGFAIHEDYTNARFHYVSLGYQFGLDKPNPGVKSYIDVQKQ